MPNHVRNKVKMTGIANLPLFTTKNRRVHEGTVYVLRFQ